MAGQQVDRPKARQLGRDSSSGGILGDYARQGAGAAGMLAGWLPGAARGAFHMGKDLWESADTLAKLQNPLLPGSLDAWADVTEGFGNFAARVASDPKAIVNDAMNDFRRFRKSVNPGASPAAPTAWGEMKRNFKIGENQGEALFNVASLAYGGAEVGAALKIARMSEAARAAKIAEDAARFGSLGYPENVARRFAAPYKGMGSHWWPRSRNLPSWLGGGRLPSFISDSPFNLVNPRNMSTGDFYKYHFEVDRSYHGGKIRKDFGGGRWSGHEFGWEKRGPIGRFFYGMPKPTKLVVGAGTLGGTGALVDAGDNWGRRP